MSFTLNDVATLAKQLVREEVSDTITLSRMETYVVLCYSDWARELMWPEATLNATTATDPTTGVTAQEYQLPEDLNVIFRVYMNGQRCAPTSISILEGDVVGLFSPNWKVLPSVEIPALTSSTIQAVPITAGPSFASLQYYLRGGYVGFSPAPATNGYPIQIDCCTIPSNVQDSTTILLPNQFKHGLAYGAIYRFLLSDRRVPEAKVWRELEQEQWQYAMRWRRRFGGVDQLPIVQPQGYRTWYSRNNVGLRVPPAVPNV